MKKSLHIFVANAAGNITIFVLNPTPRSQYEQIASQLLHMEELGGEQVAFVTGADSMEMCGLEFCGNASRSFALFRAKEEGKKGNCIINIEISGCEERLDVMVNPEENYTKIKMPLPLSAARLTQAPFAMLENSYIIDMDGIIHVVTLDVPPTEDNFQQIKNWMNHTYNPPAVGVMFYDTKEDKMTPVVYVRDVDTTYYEGSCGSGSVAAAVAFSLEEEEGTFQFNLQQPAGKITATIEKTHGKMKNIYIQGSVDLGPVQTVSITEPEQ